MKGFGTVITGTLVVGPDCAWTTNWCCCRQGAA